MKETKRSALLLVILYSLLCMEILGIWVKNTGQVEQPATYQPGVTYACLYLRDLSSGRADLPWEEARLEEEMTEPLPSEKKIDEEQLPDLPTEETVSDTAEWDGQEQTDPEEQIPVDPMEVESSFQTVDESYLEDALFIGDSRVVGLSQYSGIAKTNYAAEVGLSIYKMFDKKFLQVEGSKEKITIREMLSEHQYKKIYLMLGINELGTGDEERFRTAYREALEEIVEMQPEAVIFVQSVLHVSKEKSRTEKYINNENINIRNEGLAGLADGKRIFYLDLNSLYDDEEGNLDDSITGDGVHLKAKYYGVWKDYLLAHGIIK